MDRDHQFTLIIKYLYQVFQVPIRGVLNGLVPRHALLLSVRNTKMWKTI